jgi:hypothetical protein
VLIELRKKAMDVLLENEVFIMQKMLKHVQSKNESISLKACSDLLKITLNNGININFNDNKKIVEVKINAERTDDHVSAVAGILHKFGALESTAEETAKTEIH